MTPEPFHQPTPPKSHTVACRRLQSSASSTKANGVHPPTGWGQNPARGPETFLWQDVQLIPTERPQSQLGRVIVVSTARNTLKSNQAHLDNTQGSNNPAGLC